jgi:hypothetical protein
MKNRSHATTRRREEKPRILKTFRVVGIEAFELRCVVAALREEKALQN